MNISIYLPDSLKSRLDTYIKDMGTTKNAAVREAIELLLRSKPNKKWGSWINELTPDPEFPDIDEIRAD